jgi:hypothetical protein
MTDDPWGSQALVPHRSFWVATLPETNSIVGYEYHLFQGMSYVRFGII